MLIVDVWKLRDWRGVHKCAEEEEGERRMWRISQSHAGYLLVEDSRRSRRKITASKHYLHLLNAKATKHASQPPFHPCSNHHASGYIYPLIMSL